jgi:hypothetical protein
MHTFQVAEGAWGLTEQGSASAFDRLLPATPPPRVTYANFPGSSKGWALRS